ncbi:hypothetical protein HPB47_002080 [Ixodes persulcatus]|uniref:Uncharacterized protein n=1 Tax=Ixodes persulcatus TaxID=34615 RepID=A0AC60PP01_IXOPE|nr:hypothetical protein HPB47_002080 [Ixodes persulcatus]
MSSVIVRLPWLSPRQPLTPPARVEHRRSMFPGHRRLLTPVPGEAAKRRARSHTLARSTALGAPWRRGGAPLPGTDTRLSGLDSLPLYEARPSRRGSRRRPPVQSLTIRRARERLSAIAV